MENDYTLQQHLYMGIQTGQMDISDIIKYYKQYGIIPVDSQSQPSVEVIVVKPKLHLALTAHLI